MTPIHRIVLAIDFSAGSAAATEVASKLAAAQGDSIGLVHVFEHLGNSSVTVEHGGDEQNGICRSARQALEALRNQLAALGIASTTFFRTGLPWQKIHNVAVDVGAEFIVIGRQGCGLDGEIGSVAERLIRIATRPVLTVPARNPKV